MSTKEPINIVYFAGEYIEIAESISYRGKTGGFYRITTRILQILDKKDGAVTPIWGKDWQECMPGIETRKAENKTVRIYQQACPVYIQFRHTDEYEDYEDSRYASRYENVYWNQYEV
jgi:hypothetical protein